MEEKHVLFDEYGETVPGCFRAVKPKCPFVAVIPSITVEDKSGMKNIADALIHVANINTTFYIDDKHRITTTWAGLVSVDDYDFDANPLNLRGQWAYDAKNDIAAVYDNQGNAMILQTGATDNDYNSINNKPSINGVTLQGDIALTALGINTITNSEIDSIL